MSGLRKPLRVTSDPGGYGDKYGGGGRGYRHASIFSNNMQEETGVSDENSWNNVSSRTLSQLN